jgi:hypothetical protein
MRKLLKPILKLFFNPNPLIQALHRQVAAERRTPARPRRVERALLRGAPQPRARDDAHGIEVKNLKMRLESLTSRLDFDERRCARSRASCSTGPGPCARARQPRRTRRRAIAAAAEPRGATAAAAAVPTRRRRTPAPAARPTRAPAAGASARAAGARRADGGGQRRGARRAPMRARRRAARQPAALRRLPATPPTRGRGPDTERSEARDRRPALRRRHQRRRRAARPVHRRAPRPRHVDVEVLTTCARDYITWRNELPAGVRDVNGVPSGVSRSSRERDPREFGRLSSACSSGRIRSPTSSRGSTAEGPTSPALIATSAPAPRSTTSSSSATGTTTRSTAPRGADQGHPRPDGRARRRDRPVDLRPVFRGVRAIMYNSFEERALIQAVAGNPTCPGVVVGVGSEVPEPQRMPRGSGRSSARRPFAIYVGRIDENKGCASCSTSSSVRRADSARRPRPRAHRASRHPDPDHPRIHHLGFLPTRTSSTRSPPPTC